MPANNKKIADIFNEIADLLDIKGANEFRVRSYREAARTISGISEDIIQLADDEKEIMSLPGIGKRMAQKIKEIAKTGKLSQLEKLKSKIPEPLIEIMNLEQMGPRRTKILYDNLHIASLSDLKKALDDGEVEKLEGFGEKSVENLLKEIEEYEKENGKGRFKIAEAEEISKPLISYLEKKIDNVTIAGSFRRNKETVGDLDILATADNSEMAMDHFADYEEVSRVLSKGKSLSTVKLKSGIQVDLRIVKERSFGAALLYFTGSKSHTIALRKIGQEKGYKVNEYGIFKGKKREVSKTEKQMYEKLGLNYIEPELRENHGEIEASGKDELPSLIKLEDIRGDLQTHTNATDGRFSLDEMVEAAIEKGYEYYAITDHSKKVAMAGGLDEKRLSEQIEEIDRLNDKKNKIKILKGIEVDILEDGSLDLPDDILKELDLVVCSIHYNMKLSKKKQTRRVLRAMENPYFNIFAHPTGRKIGERSPYEIDLEKIMKEAKDAGCFLEINSDPARLDLDDKNILMAKEIGLKLSISTDAHTIVSLDNMKYGIAQARRGWLEKDDVINTRPWKDLKKLLKRH
ncbi:MAG: DNA polymerase/3'-5' exonuclease PolX [Bacteroidales bacterium]